MQVGTEHWLCLRAWNGNLELALHWISETSLVALHVMSGVELAASHGISGVGLAALHGISVEVVAHGISEGVCRIAGNVWHESEIAGLHRCSVTHRHIVVVKHHVRTHVVVAHAADAHVVEAHIANAHVAEAHITLLLVLRMHWSRTWQAQAICPHHFIMGHTIGAVTIVTVCPI